MKKIFFFVVLALFSCKDYGNPMSSDDNTNDTYSGNIQTIFIDCNGCHAYASYDDILSSGHIIAGDALSSELYKRIILPVEDVYSMPRNLPVLSEQNIERIRIWIDEGAPE
tara:strand:- start:40 stop:372 length:333 start_codon:yes stop_codon:yes gene_type:complete